MEARAERRIVEKAQYVREAVVLLADVRESLSFEAYQEDRRTRDVVERELQTAIEACLDIGRIVLRTKGSAVPETNAAVFRQLANYGILTEETGERMAEAAGFRNILAHRYGTGIDDEDVYNVLIHDLSLFETYLGQIRALLDN